MEVVLKVPFAVLKIKEREFCGTIQSNGQLKFFLSRVIQWIPILTMTPRKTDRLCSDIIFTVKKKEKIETFYWANTKCKIININSFIEKKNIFIGMPLNSKI